MNGHGEGMSSIQMNNFGRTKLTHGQPNTIYM